MQYSVVLIIEVDQFDELIRKMLKSVRKNISTCLIFTMINDTELYVRERRDTISIHPDPYKNRGMKCFQQKRVFLCAYLRS